MMRGYTLSEIDDLRELCRMKVIWGDFVPTNRNRTSASYREADVVVQAEEMLRTYMMAGITADDIRKEARP